MMSIVQLLCKASGLKINPNRSQFLEIHIDDSEVEQVANQWRHKRGPWPLLRLIFKGKFEIGDLLEGFDCEN